MATYSTIHSVMSDLIRIATRKSPLALWQAEEVSRRLRQAHPGLQVELVTMTTQGDRILDTPLARIGGKGLFVKELEQGMLEGRADIAVHSMKDVPLAFPDGLGLAVVLDREDPRDAFVSNRYPGLSALPQGARVGTSSLRRQCQLRARRPDLTLHDLRGNVGTRLRRLDEDEYDAIILAAAGLKRLGLANRITAILAPEESLPAVGQGAIGIECRADDDAVRELLAPLDDPATRTRVSAERAFNARLNGGCQVPIAGYAELLAHDRLRLRGLVGTPDGRTMVADEVSGPAAQAEALGAALADRLLARGAGEMLRGLGL